MNTQEEIRGPNHPYDELIVQGPILAGFAVTGFGVYDRLKTFAQAIDKDGVHLSTIAPLVLMLAAIWLGLGWYTAAKQELRIINRHLGEFLPQNDFTGLPFIAILALTLVTMAYFSNQPLLFCGSLLIYQILGLTAQYMVRSEAKKTLPRASDAKVAPDVIQSLTRYYVNRPYGYASWSALLLSCIAVLVLVLSATALPAFIGGNRAIIAQILSVVVIFGSEGVMWKYRYRLYRQLSG